MKAYIRAETGKKSRTNLSRSVTVAIFLSFEPQTINHFRVQHDHQLHWDNTSNKEPGKTISFREPAIGPVFMTKLSIFVKVNSQEQWNIKGSSTNP